MRFIQHFRPLLELGSCKEYVMAKKTTETTKRRTGISIYAGRRNACSAVFSSRLTSFLSRAATRCLVR